MNTYTFTIKPGNTTNGSSGSIYVSDQQMNNVCQSMDTEAVAFSCLISHLAKRTNTQSGIDEKY